MIFQVGVGIRREDSPIEAEVGKGIDDTSDLIYWQVLGLVVCGVDAPGCTSAGALSDGIGGNTIYVPVGKIEVILVSSVGNGRGRAICQQG